MKQRFWMFGLVALAAALTGCVSFTEVTAVVVAVENEIVDEVQSAEGGDLLITYENRPYRTVQLIGDGRYTYAPAMNFQFEGGEEFYQVADRSGRLVPIYCMVRYEYSSVNPLYDNDNRWCLMDADSDSRFETLYTMVEVNRNISADGGKIETLAISEETDIPFAPSEPSVESHVTMAVRFETPRLGSPSLVAGIVGLNGRFIEFGPGDPIPDTLPSVMNIGGVMVEVLTLNEGTLTYRIDSVPAVGERSLIIRTVRTIYVPS